MLELVILRLITDSNSDLRQFYHQHDGDLMPVARLICGIAGTVRRPDRACGTWHVTNVSAEIIDYIQHERPSGRVACTSYP